MQGNTAAAGKFANISVENRKTDPFRFAEGHYVGHDGFVVPKDFDDFYRRFPQHVGSWVRRHAGETATKEYVEDWTQDLLIRDLQAPQLWQAGHRADLRPAQAPRCERCPKERIAVRSATSSAMLTRST